MGQGSRQQCNWSTLENDRRQMADQKSEWIRSRSRLCHLKEYESRGKESPSKTSNNSEPLLVAQIATQSKTTKGRKPTQIVAEYELRMSQTPQGAERLDRRSEVVNEALAEEIQRGEQRKEKQQSYNSSTSMQFTRIERESD